VKLKTFSIISSILLHKYKKARKPGFFFFFPGAGFGFQNFSIARFVARSIETEMLRQRLHARRLNLSLFWLFTNC
jgi:hypothetical protein